MAWSLMGNYEVIYLYNKAQSAVQETGSELQSESDKLSTLTMAL